MLLLPDADDNAGDGSACVEDEECVGDDRGEWSGLFMIVVYEMYVWRFAIGVSPSGIWRTKR